MDDKRYENLPEWAQEHIAFLGRRVKEVTVERDAFVNKTPTRVKWGYQQDGSLYGYLDINNPVRFQVDQCERHTITVRLLKDGDGIFIGGWDRIRIEPEGSNACTIRLVDYAK